ncbi:transglycosylase SLT domain-containing protein [Arenimonas sp.]|uniref:transglycosylase SLT domain-containing protein n=1 Tax=Arenimonas sp. TaxID=1872635 RepID=UPI0039E6B6EA
MGRLHFLIWLGLAFAGPATAGGLYRCVGTDGIPNYSSKRVPGAQCKLIATTPSPAPKRSEPAAAETTATASNPAPVQAASRASDPKAPDQVKTAGFTPRFLRMAHSTIYSYTDANGVRNFSNRRPKGASNVSVSRIEYAIFSQPSCYACAVLPGTNFGRVTLNTTAFSGEIRSAALQYGVEEAVVRAIIHAESAFRPHVVSPKNAQGLMQLIPATASRFGVSDPFDPGQNIRGGVQYLAWLMKRYRSDLTLVAAAYNAGEGAVDRYNGVPPYNETRRYVERVGQLAQRYREAPATP